MRRGRWITGILALTLAGMLSVAGCADAGSYSGKNEEGGTKAGTDLSQTETDEQKADKTVFGDFTSWSLDGTEVTQDIFAEADLTMVNIWGTFCGPCIDEMPELGELSREYEGKGVQIVGMLCDVYEPGGEKAEKALEIIGATKADYTHIVASDDLLRGTLGTVQAVPTTVFLDKEGKQVGQAYAGAADKETWKKRIDELRKEVQ